MNQADLNKEVRTLGEAVRIIEEILKRLLDRIQKLEIRDGWRGDPWPGYED